MTLHAIPVELANGTAGVFSSVANVAQTVNMLFGGPNRGKPISYEAIHGEMMRQAFPEQSPDHPLDYESQSAAAPTSELSDEPAPQVEESTVPDAREPEIEDKPASDRSAPDLSMF